MLGPNWSTFTLITLCCLALPTLAQEEAETKFVAFDRDVWPIIESKCIECHGPEDAKNDFRMDEAGSVSDYLEPRDLESSLLWTDYLTTDDESLQMPPPGKPQLTGVELATIKLWIEEGAEWIEPISPEPKAEQANDEAVLPTSDAGKYWLFSGLFHPAIIHFPVALLTVSAGFCFLSFFNKQAFEPVAYHCLWIGALGAIGACVTGWAYGVYEGYGPAELGTSNAIDRHRWLGICVALVSLLLIPVARSVKKSEDAGMRFFWMLGALALVAGVSIVGYQGGELVYGEDHYMKEYGKLFPDSGETEANTDGLEDSADDNTNEQLAPLEGADPQKGEREASESKVPAEAEQSIDDPADA